jgi:hypothetical protein
MGILGKSYTVFSIQKTEGYNSTLWILAFCSNGKLAYIIKEKAFPDISY